MGSPVMNDSRRRALASFTPGYARQLDNWFRRKKMRPESTTGGGRKRRRSRAKTTHSDESVVDDKKKIKITYAVPTTTWNASASLPESGDRASENDEIVITYTVPTTYDYLKGFYERSGNDIESDRIYVDEGAIETHTSESVGIKREDTDVSGGGEEQKTEDHRGETKRRCSGRERERRQRMMRDLFRRNVLTLANRWMSCLCVADRVKRNVVVNDERQHTAGPWADRGGDNEEDHEDDTDNDADTLFQRQNGYFYYNILCTPEIQRLVSRRVDGREELRHDERPVVKLAHAADVYLRVMFNADIRPSVFIKFDDKGSPFLFARQTKRSPDTCTTGPPGHYWTRVLHLECVAKTSQHVALQRVRSGRLIQDCTFTLVGEGLLQDTPDCFVSPSLRHRKYFKEIHGYITSLPEIDLSSLGWETVNGNGGVVDPLKTFLPRVFDADNRPADDAAFVDYVDMFVTMVTDMLNMERQPTAGARVPGRVKVYRTEYKFEFAGRTDHPGVHYFRNAGDYITDMCMANGQDSLLSPEEQKARVEAADTDDDGVYFYDVKPVRDVEMRLACIGIGTEPARCRDFYRYVLSECDEIKEMIAYSSNTINHRLADAVNYGRYVDMHETDPARKNPTSCLGEHMAGSSVCTDMSEYRTTYYIYKSTRLRRALNDPPRDLESNDCVLRVYRLKWMGRTKSARTIAYKMYPYFAIVFKHFSVYEIVKRQDTTWKDGGVFTFPEYASGHPVPSVKTELDPSELRSIEEKVLSDLLCLCK